MPTYTATLASTTLATTTDYQTIEGNIYFPPSSLKKSYFTPSSTHTHCSWKGEASYYDIEIEGKVVKDAAWYYLEPLEGAKGIEGWVAFYKSKVEVTSE